MCLFGSGGSNQPLQTNTPSPPPPPPDVLDQDAPDQNQSTSDSSSGGYRTSAGLKQSDPSKSRTRQGGSRKGSKNFRTKTRRLNTSIGGGQSQRTSRSGGLNV